MSNKDVRLDEGYRQLHADEQRGRRGFKVSLLLSPSSRSFKSADKELNQLRFILAHLGEKADRLCVPSTALLDIAGFRFNIVSALPIQNSSSLYNQENPSPQVTSRLPQLNEAAQYAVWRGDDHRNYMIGCTELLPSDPLSAPLYDYQPAIRYEVADELMGRSASEIQSALLSQIESVCQELEQLEDPPCCSAELSIFLHGRGVSMRHLGLMYNCATQEWLRQLLYVDMLARTIKNIFWKHLRCLIYQEKPQADVTLAESQSSPSAFAQHFGAHRKPR